ncbi:hypothetical protein [Rhodanobacter sp. B04]|uniref:hypothetical protein n=1 Tax=Rhodanobacter sp. B04 TaxID=1945860 RepID=UPI0011156E7D|nr:hypothetical protein [Rhodanobacter sp. B04]
MNAQITKRRRPKGTIASGKVLSFIRANGEWLALVVLHTSERNLPVLSRIVPISDLKGSARRKADRWLEYLA